MELPDIAADPRRLVRLDAVHNFRDMGGYPTHDGHTTAWGRLFRADGLYRLTADDLEVVRGLGLRTVIDLRSAAELEERGTFPVDRHPVDFHHVPVITETWTAEDAEGEDDPADFLERAYLAMLDEGEERLAEAFVRLAEPDALPAVFHCAAGKDRTGMLAMMVLGSLGVRDEYIVADYSMTEAGMLRMREWAMREYPELFDRIDAGPAIFSAAVPEAMRRMLGHVREWHGGVREFVLAVGVPEEALERLRSALLV
ncbi:MAG: tyrosine-protein phosphatase [Ilumatobacteraceae bacterium]